MKKVNRWISTAVLASALALVAPLSAANATPTVDSSSSTQQGPCSAGWRYASTGRGADTFSQVGIIHSNYNGTGSPASSTFTATTSGTVSATVSGSTNIGLSVKVASVGATYGIAATTSMTVTTGNAITITIPAYRTGNGKYGAWRAYVNGTEKYYTSTCAVTQTKSTTTNSPYKRGWVTWID